MDIRSALQHQEQSIQTLLQGCLPYQFVSPDELTHTLQEIADIFPAYEIGYTEIGYYYHLNDVTYHRVNNKLFLKIKIPLTTTTFTLYRINNVPIPIGPDRKEHSLLSSLTNRILQSAGTIYFMLLFQKMNTTFVLAIS